MSFIRKSQFIIVLAVVYVFASGLSAEARLTHEDARAVWNQVAQDAGLTNLTFGIEDEEDANAWVTNGEAVTATTGLLDLLETRAELYGILAHEAGHAKLNHHRDMADEAPGVEDILIELEDIFAEVISAFFGGKIAEAADGVGEDLLEAAWSRAQEIEADRYAVKLMYESKEDMLALYSAVQRLSAFDGEQDMDAFSSHPSHEKLLFLIKKEILKYDPTATFPEPLMSGVK